MKQVTLIFSVLLILFSLTVFPTAPASAAVRRCNASLGWETTGGSLKGGIIDFTGIGKCGSRFVANRCRTRARQAIERCVRTQYERRWEHHPFKSNGSPDPDYDQSPPEACLRAANIEGYSLEKNCWTRRKDGKNSVRVCHNVSGQESVPSYIDSRDVKRVSTAGDIKSALAASVCCFKDHGQYPFPNEKKVYVRLIAQSSSGNDPQKKCKMSLQLNKKDYIINCQRTRETLCRK